MNIDPSIFKDYDVRGTYPEQINAEVVTGIAHAIARVFSPRSVAIIRDMRTSGVELRDAMVSAFTKIGIDVFDAGVAGTELQYYIGGTKSYDLVIMLSASHNPANYNGIKLILRGPIAVTRDSGWSDIQKHISDGPLPHASIAGHVTTIDVWDEWKKLVLSLVDTSLLLSLAVVVDAGNGMGGVHVDKIFSNVPVQLTKLYFEPDGTFPHHVPNPLVESNNRDLIDKVLSVGADCGITFDGDADRMFLIDDRGRFVSGTITTALLARYFLARIPGSLILYNAICGRIVPEIITKLGGKSKRVRVGHSFIKTYMKETGALFAGEHSGHYYYRDFFNAESGVLSALLILSILSQEKKKLSELVDELNVYPSSGEMNFHGDAEVIIPAIKRVFSSAQSIDELDGVSIWYDNWWCNIRPSKTEPLMRLNVEADNAEILGKKTQEITSKILELGGIRA